MRPKAEEFLYFLLWSTDKLMRPTFHNLIGSYESWAYRNGLMFQLRRLEQRQLVERDDRSPKDRLYRLTAEGRLHALGGRDPQARWSLPWDGRWRMALFDVPVNRRTHRERLRRYLRGKYFGCLQGSVWIRITPDQMQGERELLADGKVNVKSLLLLEARPYAGESDAEIVAGAWDFERINRRYGRYLKVLEKFPNAPLRDEATARALRSWAANEREAWLSAIAIDPLLPERLLPVGYLGRRAWSTRADVFRRAGERLWAFKQ
jgi:phenylacetic acid degradation operon negative regulatory protein